MKKLFLMMALLICQLSEAAVKINNVVRNTYSILPNEVVSISDNKNTASPRTRLLLNANNVVIQNNTNNLFLVEDLGTYTLVGYDGNGGILLSTFTITTKLLPKANSFGFAAYCTNLDSFALSCNYPLADSIAWFKDGITTGKTGNQIWVNSQGTYTYDVYYWNKGIWQSVGLLRTCATKNDESKIIDNSELMQSLDRCKIYDMFGREFTPTTDYRGVCFQVCVGEKWRKIYVN